VGAGKLLERVVRDGGEVFGEGRYGGGFESFRAEGKGERRGGERRREESVADVVEFGEREEARGWGRDVAEARASIRPGIGMS